MSTRDVYWSVNEYQGRVLECKRVTGTCLGVEMSTRDVSWRVNAYQGRVLECK
jgi:hypothetical protein